MTSIAYERSPSADTKREPVLATFGVLDSIAVRVSRSVVIARPRAAVFPVFLHVEALPRFLPRLVRVEVIEGAPERQRWILRGPLGIRMTWTTELAALLPDRMITWRSLPGALVPSAASVQLADSPGGRGTEVKVSFTYRPPFGRLGRALVKVLIDPPKLSIRGALRRIKAFLETGDLAQRWRSYELPSYEIRVGG